MPIYHKTLHRPQWVITIRLKSIITTRSSQSERTREQAYFNSYDFDAIEVLPYDDDEDEEEDGMQQQHNNQRAAKASVYGVANKDVPIVVVATAAATAAVNALSHDNNKHLKLSSSDTSSTSLSTSSNVEEMMLNIDKIVFEILQALRHAQQQPQVIKQICMPKQKQLLQRPHQLRRATVETIFYCLEPFSNIKGRQMKASTCMHLNKCPNV
ncbi:hypothetical protein EVAR_71258_1 [Eumeta japonica]|uniref:Uncharacterized protein n=1 Tax=Eumeta variegata TaxID=151549 RepID=A0A4C1T4C3_EUMVA|nr:hypothetical protein EVAR_71258_1 [Eumeta japonica]